MRTIVPAALLLAACSSTHVTFDRDASQESALWSLELGETRVEVRAQGRDTLVSWRNRTLLFTAFDSFHGTVRLRTVDLVGPRLKVRIRDDGVTVTTDASDTFQPIAALPEGKVSVWRERRWIVPEPQEPLYGHAHVRRAP